MNIDEIKITNGENEFQTASFEPNDKMIDYETSKNLGYVDVISILKGLDVISEFYDVNAAVTTSGAGICAVSLGKTQEEAINNVMDSNPIDFMSSTVTLSKEVDSDISKLLKHANRIVAPSYTKNADCRLSLTVNCRNTNNIAETSIRPLNLPKKYRNIKIRPDSVIGDTTTLYASVDKDKQLEHLNLFIKKCISKSINPKEIVIISCKTKSEIENGNSLLSNYGSEYICYSVNIKITNCADFKGLEADAVILIDVDKGTFNTQKNCNRFYVAASRAKFNLYIICDMTQEDCAICSEIIQNKKENLPDNISLENIKLKNAEKRFAATLNATILS